MSQGCLDAMVAEDRAFGNVETGFWPSHWSCDKPKAATPRGHATQRPLLGRGFYVCHEFQKMGFLAVDYLHPYVGEHYGYIAGIFW